jgi:cytochrome c-type biogenesis protein CcmH
VSGRREFLVGALGAAATLAAVGVRSVGGQQPTNFVPMDQGSFRPTMRPAKPDATPLLDDDARDALEKQLKCQCGCILDVYTCRTTDFTCSVSPAMHRDVMRLIAGGYNEEEILAAFVETYGEVALTAPVKEGFNWLGYLAPGIVLATGALLLTLMLRRWSVAAAAARAASAAAPSSRAASTEATVDEMERLARALREDS